MALYNRPHSVMVSAKITCLNSLKKVSEKWRVLEAFTEKCCDLIFKESPTMEDPQACANEATKWTGEEKSKVMLIVKRVYEEIVISQCETSHTTHCSFQVCKI